MSNLNYHREIAIDIFQDNAIMQSSAKVKTINTIAFEHEDNEAKAEAVLLKWHGWTKGVHYARFEVRVVKEEGTKIGLQESKDINLTEIYQEPNSSPAYQRKIHKEEMTKKNNNQIEEAHVIEETATPPQEQQVEEAELVEESGDTEFKATLPAIPSVFVVKGKEHSLAQVADIKKRADELSEKATPESYEDKKLWDEINDLRIEAKDQRTKLEGKRKELVKPINDALSALKKNTDEIGSEAKKVEDSLEKLIADRNNWEAEQEKLRLAEIAKRTEKRKEELRALDGRFDVDNGVFSFDYDRGTFINTEQIDGMTDEEFAAEVATLTTRHTEEKERLAKEKQEQQAKAAEADKAKAQLVEMREMILQSGGYEKTEHGWVKNRNLITEAQLSELENKDFIQLTIAHNEPPKQESVEHIITPEEPAPFELPTQPVVSSEPPFDPLGDVIASKVDEHTQHQENVAGTKRIELVFTKDEPVITLSMGNSVLILTHQDYEDVALANIDAEREVLAKAVHGDLILSAIGKPRKK